MKLKTIALVSILPLSLMMGGCSIQIHDGETSYKSGWENTEKANRRHIAQLEPGMSYSQVKDLMGLPDFNELETRDGRKEQRLYYRTHRADADGETTKDECTPILFVNDKLVSWGPAAMM